MVAAVCIVILNYQPGCQEWVIQYVCTGRWGEQSSRHWSVFIFLSKMYY